MRTFSIVGFLILLSCGVCRADERTMLVGFEDCAVGEFATNLPGFHAEGGGFILGDVEGRTASHIERHPSPIDFDGACGVPDAFKDRANEKFLRYDTFLGEGCLWRTMADFSEQTDGQLFVDALVQLDVWAEGSSPEDDMAPGQRIQIWVEEDETFRTNVCVAALLYHDDGWDTTVTTNVFKMVNQFDFSTGVWHRVTMKAIADVTRAHARNPEWYPEGVQGFQIWIDGELLQADGIGSFSDEYINFLAFEENPEWGWLVKDNPVDEAVADLLQSGTVFADLRGEGTGGLAQIGFAGTGKADDLCLTMDEPAGFRSQGFDAVLLDEANIAFAETSAAAVDSWLTAIGSTAATVARDPHGFESFLLGTDLGLANSPCLTISRIEQIGPEEWELTVNVTVRGTDGEAVRLVLQDGTRPTINGVLEVRSANDLSDLPAAEVRAVPLVLPPDQTELKIRVDSDGGAFFSARIR